MPPPSLLHPRPPQQMPVRPTVRQPSRLTLGARLSVRAARPVCGGRAGQPASQPTPVQPTFLTAAPAVNQPRMQAKSPSQENCGTLKLPVSRSLARSLARSETNTHSASLTFHVRIFFRSLALRCSVKLVVVGGVVAAAAGAAVDALPLPYL